MKLGYEILTTRSDLENIGIAVVALQNEMKSACAKGAQLEPGAKPFMVDLPQPRQESRAAMDYLILILAAAERRIRERMRRASII